MADVRKFGTSIPLPVWFPVNATLRQRRSSIGDWSFVSFACLVAIAIAVLSIW